MVKGLQSKVRFISGVVAFASLTSLSHASFLFTASSGDLKASALFSQSGTTLTVVLTNTATVATPNQDSVLTGLFFNLSGNPLLLANTAVLTSGSSVNPAQSVNLANEWGFRNNLGASELSFTDSRYGVSAVGMDAFGQGFGPNPANIGGTDYGIISSLGRTGQLTQGANANRRYVRNSITFTFTLPQSYTVTAFNIRDVAFHYGSSQSQPTTYSVNVVPGPAAALPFLLGLAAAARRRRKS